MRKRKRRQGREEKKQEEEKEQDFDKEKGKRLSSFVSKYYFWLVLGLFVADLGHL